MSESEPIHSGFRQNMVDFDTVQKMIDDDLTAREEHDATHPFVAAAASFDGSSDAEAMADAVQAMLKNAEAYENLYNPAGSQDSIDMRNRLDSRTLAFDNDTQRVIHIVRQAAYARGALLAGDARTYNALVGKLIENIDDEVEPDVFAASDIALQYITADLAQDNPAALTGLINYATALHGAQNSMNFSRLADDSNNQTEAIALMRIATDAARELADQERVTAGELATAMKIKYDMLAIAGGDAAVAEEKKMDERDPALKQMIFAINQIEIEKFRDEQRAAHKFVVSPDF